MGASDDEKKPMWKIHRVAGSGEVLAGDEIVLGAEGKRLAIVNGWAYALGCGDAEESSKFVIQCKQPGPARVGFQGTLISGFEDVEWFGRGPHESYCDRNASARIALYKGRIVDQTFKYVRPQENGNKFETRWMVLKNAACGGCAGILVAGGASSRILQMHCHRYALA